MAACGSCLLLLLLSCHVPCTAAQDKQDINLTAGATGAMRMLAGFWQGTVADQMEDGSTRDVCAQQVIFGNGTILQVRPVSCCHESPACCLCGFTTALAPVALLCVVWPAMVVIPVYPNVYAPLIKQPAATGILT